MAVDENEYWAAVSTVIRMEMTAQSMSQAKLADLVGIGRVALNHYLSGKREIPFMTLMKIMNVMNLSLPRVLDEAERRMK